MQRTCPHWSSEWSDAPLECAPVGAARDIEAGLAQWDLAQLDGARRSLGALDEAACVVPGYLRCRGTALSCRTPSTWFRPSP
jgi:hypothetical protein